MVVFEKLIAAAFHASASVALPHEQANVIWDRNSWRACRFLKPLEGFNLAAELFERPLFR